MPLSSLSSEQQTLLSAVPRWKRAWVRPSTLKEGQNPNYKVCKWVIDTGKAEERATDEEMRAATSLVASGEAAALPAAVSNESKSPEKEGEDAMQVDESTTAVASVAASTAAPTTTATPDAATTPAADATPTAPASDIPAAPASVPVPVAEPVESEPPPATESAIPPPVAAEQEPQQPSASEETKVEPIQASAQQIEKELQETRAQEDGIQEDEVELAKESMAIDA